MSVSAVFNLSTFSEQIIHSAFGFTLRVLWKTIYSLTNISEIYSISDRYTVKCTESSKIGEKKLPKQLDRVKHYSLSLID